VTTLPLKHELARLRAETPASETLIHFNNAGAGLMPGPVVRTVTDHLLLEAEIGGYETQEARASEIAAFYDAVAMLLGCSPSSVAFTASATDAYTRALSAVPFESGDRLLTTRNDYISNQIVFMALSRRYGIEVIHAPDAADGQVDIAALESIIRTQRPRLVAVTHVPTDSGLVQPVSKIGAICREYGTLYLVDACQSVGQLAVDVAAIGCDFLSATGRKFLRGPRGTGFLYVSPRTLAAGLEPLFIDMRGAAWTEKQGYTSADTAQRFEEWESPYALKLGLAAAVRYAIEIGLEPITLRASALAAELRLLLHGVDGVRVLDRGREHCAIVTVAVDGWNGDDFHRELTARSINSGISLLEHSRFDFNDKGVDWALRLSPHYYNTCAEVEEVATAVAEVAASR
jgi:selenocysteine lyase/cysteine desulfurase